MRFQSFCRWPRPACGALAGALFLLTACGQKPAATPNTGPVSQQSSDSSASEQVSLTVYNKNFGLVREVRKVHLGTGNVELSYADVSAHIQPETVHLKSLSGDNQVTILEQNYRYDLLSPATLLEKYLGKTIKVYRYNEHTGREEEKQAEVLSVEGGTVLKIDDQITSNFAGRFAFPKVPENLLQKPTLVWLLASTAAEQRVEVAYLTQGLDWHADYVLSIDADDKFGDLNGWVTLKNETGTSYKNAQLKLVAGDVQRVAPEVQPMAADMAAPVAPEPAPRPFKEEGLFEYHLYTLERPTSLRDKEQKQVSLLSAANIALAKKLIFFGQQYWFRVQVRQPLQNQKVGVFLDFQNEEKNHLGMALPKGTLRVYKSDKAGQKQFIGEDAIDHTPRDEKVRVKLGEAFDVVADRSELAFRALGTCSSESDWEIKLRNHKDTEERVEVNEPAGGDWEIVSSSLPATKKDSQTFSFDVRLAPRSETKLTYRVRVRWC
ncbi:MAG TPA: DUF4139 domain-containing protein [Polyangiaceae bacterium]|nr:DUF4139 domain-containing protein [Polyangiaceae bacterium]